ncbi:MAG: hypothetical protein A2Y79_08495 [Deltaproteobacteria bacterium RBG_13_43_22]|nr:MAG: hypothetical protein A2Y79_08495 [Deltaproteobacteria bacterium RBG_13_43_22]
MNKSIGLIIIFKIAYFIDNMLSSKLLIWSSRLDEFVKSHQRGRHSKKLQMPGVQILGNEAYREVRRNKPAPVKTGEGCSTTQHMDF